jgi:hypothetical protein
MEGDVGATVQIEPDNALFSLDSGLALVRKSLQSAPRLCRAAAVA